MLRFAIGETSVSKLGEVSRQLLDVRKASRETVSKLVPMVYLELRRLASRFMKRERSDHTLQTTALVHEAYLKLVGKGKLEWIDRTHFIGIAAHAMREILVEHARAYNASKRGGEEQKVQLTIEVPAGSEERSVDLLALDVALNKLAALSPRQCQVIEMRFFGGLSVEETAEALSISPKTVKRDWSAARAWLHREMRRDAKPDCGPKK